MEQNREIEALLHLIDDPDEDVFLSVQERLMHYGRPVIPNLENMWENTISESVQDRIEMTIHGIQYRGLTAEFTNWKNGEAELLYGALLVAKYQYPEIQTLNALQEVERMRRNIWLEMNSYMTPLEQVKVMESILYNYYRLRGGEVDYRHPNEFMLHKVIESKKGNAISMGILYLLFAELLDLPVRVINIPRQFVLAWFNPQALFNHDYGGASYTENISFYIDPNTGAAFSHRDIELYFKRIEIPTKPHHFKPLNNKQIVRMLLQQLSACFQKPHSAYKQQELNQLASLLDA
ncbi:MAG: hypothetical protein EAY75_08760 [Bacteroidetes bacterium]|nr:MAG: hypothetical protein EAY75_08760 [Bacteroidota bacterium]